MESVKSYYRTRGSQLGYKYLLNGVRHFGYYPNGTKISRTQAQINMMEQVAQRLGLKPKAKILDAGCGEGETALYLAKKYGIDVYGIDLLKESIEIASRKSIEYKTQAAFVEGDFTALPYPSNFFDGVYALETFIHSPDPLATLKELKRVLKPGGCVVIADYTSAPLSELPVKYQQVLKWGSTGTSAPGLMLIHHDYYDKNLPKIGFINTEVVNVTQYIMPMLRLFRRLSFLPFQIIKLLGTQNKHTNSLMAYYGMEVAKKGWWRFVIVSAQKS